ncbi:hypothetical protein [Photorhabdus luminescens]|nr:hypothetical protein [Photorhabdus luminescens]MCW7763465.1 hypothetical protein [Photorhabdus luminescens subsp. venezuelensis]
MTFEVSIIAPSAQHVKKKAHKRVMVPALCASKWWHVLRALEMKRAYA